jgi:zinc transporter ZupT
VNQSVWYVLLAGIAAILCTGLGAVPFFFLKNVSNRLLGIANASAAGLMFGASVGLIWEGLQFSIHGLFVGVLLGMLLIATIQKQLGQHENFQMGDIQGADALKMLLIIGIMTVHSFAEGLGVGVSFGNTMSFGVLIAAAIAIHKIPEGIAISLVMIPRGATIWQAAKWSMFSSLPLALMAVLAYLAVTVFSPLLSLGLGIAAGGMFWMVFHELLPEAFVFIPRRLAYVAMLAAFVVMVSFQFFLGG